MDLSALGLPELTGFAAALAAFTVSIIDFLKRLVTKNIRGAWTAKIPSGVWYGLAIGIPTAICVPLGLDWFQSLSGEQIPANLAPYSSAATGVLVGIGASGSYKAKELGKAALVAKGINVPTTYKPDGPLNPDYVAPAEVNITPSVINDSPQLVAEESTKPEQSVVPEPTVVQDVQTVQSVQQPERSHNGNSNTQSGNVARLLRFTKPHEAADLALIDGDEPALYPVEYELTGPSERSPNHVVILRGKWRTDA